MQVYLRDRSAQTRLRAATLRSCRSNYLIQSQYIDTGPTSTRVDPTKLGAWHESHWCANFQVTGMTRPGKISTPQAGIKSRIFLEADALTTRPTRRSHLEDRRLESSGRQERIIDRQNNTGERASLRRSFSKTVWSASGLFGWR